MVMDGEAWHTVKAEYLIMWSPILQIEFSSSILDCDIARLTDKYLTCVIKHAWAYGKSIPEIKLSYFYKREAESEWAIISWFYESQNAPIQVELDTT